MVVAEDIYDQINRKKVWKEGFFVKDRTKNSLRSFTYNCLDLDLKQYFTDRKRIRLLADMSRTLTILKPDKGNGIVILKSSDYISSLKSLFNNITKFNCLNEDPTSTRLNTFQNYLLTLLKRNEISESEFNFMRPKASSFSRAHSMSKIYKTYTDIPLFRPIADTTTTPHYNVGKFLSSLLNPLTINEYHLTDSFEPVSTIKAIPQNLFDEGFRFVSFDIESLFTNVPLKRSLNLVLKRVFTDGLIETTLSKRILKKLLLDARTKTVFSFDNTLYEQIDGVSMSSCLAPVLANIILTEFEKLVCR